LRLRPFVFSIDRTNEMPRYLALIYRPEPEQETCDSQEFQSLFRAYEAFSRRAVAAGVRQAAAALHPSSMATTVRVRDQRMLITDGPFAESKEQVGGFYVLECKDLDEAIEWVAQMPNAVDGAIEVRPIFPG
jgi:hypothetical protein